MTPAGLIAPRWTKADDARMAELLAEGRTARQVGRALGRTRSAVLRRGVTLRARAGEPAQTETPRAPEDRRTRKPATARRPAPVVTYDDLVQAGTEVEQAQAALARARTRHRQAMEHLLGPVRDAMHDTGLVALPVDDEDDPAWRLAETLRLRGIELRRVS